MPAVLPSSATLGPSQQNLQLHILTFLPFTIRAGGVTRAKSWQQLPLAKLIHILHSLGAQIRLIH